MPDYLQSLLTRIRACTLCEDEMRRAPNPILQATANARILVVGQAPGNLADVTGTPFNDPSGDRLRGWMAVTREEFYDASRIAIVPMGFCFPGYDDKGSDIPPMQRCATVWRQGLLGQLKNIRLTLLVGSYAQRWHLATRRKQSLTETVKAWREYRSEHLFTLPHPSWRNTGWLKKNPWFEQDVLPALQGSVRAALQH